MLSSIISSFIVLLFVSIVQTDESATQLKNCTEKQIKYSYTTCDENGNHWRVQVPSSTDCSLNSPSPPTLALPCDFSCDPGQFLDINSQKCLNCPEGMYSSGDIKRYSTWSSLPEGFTTRGSDGDDQSSNPDSPCANAGWSTRGDYIESNGSSCKSILTYEVNLVKPGNISFSVKSGDEASFLHVYVKGSVCWNNYQDFSLEEQDRYISLTRNWVSYKLRLQKGLNTVFFAAAYFASMFQQDNPEDQYASDSEKTVMIKDILVEGFAFSNECERCEPGTFSREGASFCQSCEANTFSKGGLGVCEKCKEEEYSFPKAQKCLPRNPCQQTDYEEYWEQCDAEGKTRKVYRWIEPKICSSTNSNSVKLPEPTEKVECPPCNPGFYNNGSDCFVCPKNTFSNGRGDCKPCPPKTKGKPGLHFRFWDQLPSSGPMHLFCLADRRFEDGCRTSTGWSVSGSYISTGIGHSDDAQLVMYISVTAFTEDTSTFTMTFEQSCLGDESCRTKFQEVDAGHAEHDILTFEGSLPKRSFSHSRHSRNGVMYRIVFEKKYNPNQQTFKSQMSRLQIYSIDITNVENGGTETCEPCETGRIEFSDCISCRPGHYIESEKCIPCPENTYLPPSATTSKLSIETCQNCPEGLVSESGSTSCYSNCLYKVTDDQSTRTYNFSALAGFHLVKGAPQFTSRGYQFYHLYNISLCGNTRQESICIDNATRNGPLEFSEFVQSGVCRSTMIPDDANIISAQIMSIGQSLLHVKAVQDTSDGQVNKTYSKSSRFEILSFTFLTKRFTQICKNGTIAVVHLTCDPKQSGNNAIQIGSQDCQVETCDGCKFEFTWKTMHACPRCTKDDYEAIATGCENGKKKVRYVWKEPHVCLGNIEKPEDIISECSILEKSILDFKLAIGAFLFGAVMLAILVVYLCCRNRSLSYKYNRLVDISMVKDGEFPESEKCALEVGEEDDEVILSKPNGSSKLLKRIKGLRKNKDKDHKFTEFETINLDSMKDGSGDDDEL